MKFNLYKKSASLITILSITFLIGLSTSSYAQYLIKDQVFEYDSFHGGLNTRISPFKLPKNSADIVENIRFDDEYGSLTKRDKTVVACTANGTSDPIIGLYRLYLKDSSKVTIVNYDDTIVTCDSAGDPTTILTVTSADNRWDWVTWHDTALGMDGANQPVKYDGLSSSATFLGSLLATDAGSGSGPTGSDYKYKVSCY